MAGRGAAFGRNENAVEHMNSVPGKQAVQPLGASYSSSTSNKALPGTGSSSAGQRQWPARLAGHLVPGQAHGLRQLRVKHHVLRAEGGRGQGAASMEQTAPAH